MTKIFVSELSRMIAVTMLLELGVKISRRDSPEIYNLSVYKKQEIEVGIEQAKFTKIQARGNDLLPFAPWFTMLKFGVCAFSHNN